MRWSRYAPTRHRGDVDALGFSREPTVPLAAVSALLLLVVALIGPVEARAQESVEVTVEVTDDTAPPPPPPAATPTPDPEPTDPDPTPEPTPPASPGPEPTIPSPPGDAPVDPAPDPDAPADPVVDQPPRDPLPRTGADLLRLIRDALALIAGGLALVLATRRTDKMET